MQRGNEVEVVWESIRVGREKLVVRLYLLRRETNRNRHKRTTEEVGRGPPSSEWETNHISCTSAKKSSFVPGEFLLRYRAVQLSRPPVPPPPAPTMTEQGIVGEGMVQIARTCCRLPATNQTHSLPRAQLEDGGWQHLSLLGA